MAMHITLAREIRWEYYTKFTTNFSKKSTQRILAIEVSDMFESMSLVNIAEQLNYHNSQGICFVKPNDTHWESLYKNLKGVQQFTGLQWMPRDLESYCSRRWHTPNQENRICDEQGTGSTKVTGTFDHFLEPLPQSSLKAEKLFTMHNTTCLMNSGIIQSMMPPLVSNMTLQKQQSKLVVSFVAIWINIITFSDRT
ncbi:LOW QUALITY PROTEIN: hypothetical protein PHMEG_00032034 [Phytophthora megakarya]|uniref:Uncharacterized protein n=1 Tax=Phytophthora megakarya TaxID=4795 RepID=A0A225UWW2_9STRA|nr:LOW QUALITY PROTEIN: hypothetical protein PHMEG_00032034 [Phytophthora megakarya]